MGYFKEPRVFRDSKGFSLVELAVVAGLVAIVALGMAGVMSQSAQIQRSLAQKSETLIFKNYLVDLMSKDELCSCMVEGVTVNKNNKKVVTSLPKLREGCTLPQKNLLTKGKDLPGSVGYGIKVRDITFGEVESMGGGGTLYKGVLAVHLEFQDSIDRHPIKIPTIFSLPAAGSTIGANACANSDLGRAFSCYVGNTNPQGTNFGAAINVQADICAVSNITFDQSQSGHSSCQGSKMGKKWNLQVTHKDSPTSCRWTCFGGLPSKPPAGCQWIN